MALPPHEHGRLRGTASVDRVPRVGQARTPTGADQERPDIKKGPTSKGASRGSSTQRASAPKSGQTAEQISATGLTRTVNTPASRVGGTQPRPAARAENTVFGDPTERPCLRPPLPRSVLRSFRWINASRNGSTRPAPVLSWAPSGRPSLRFLVPLDKEPGLCRCRSSVRQPFCSR